MLTKRRFCRIFAILSLTVLVPLWAHDLYLMPSVFRTHNGATIVVSLHNGDAFPLSEVAPTPERLQDVRLTGTDSEAAVRDLKIVGNETVGTVLVPASGSLVLSVRTLPNHIDLPPDKFLSYLKEEGLDDVIAWRARHDETAQPGRERYTKFAKSLIQSDKSDSFFGHVVGFPIEIIPLSDPYAVHAGSRLPVRVLFRGKPIAGLQMETAWASHGASKTTVIGRTSADGSIAVPITAAGMWRLHTLKMKRCSEPAVADWESYWASLTFEII